MNLVMHTIFANLPTGFEVLGFRSLKGTERLSTLYTFDVEVSAFFLSDLFSNTPTERPT